ncbi:hypothetical protein [Phenylobacterium sp. J367]|uniref:hypothetical protein n=1 Tax=Phenylobacterium sp. J367 TaxID=2898435 RepID=UPI002151FA86|nr:hypothetical protein [Phenylobacterium sp. J367]MCR5880401.1 hypothetical protein [Phenylobacterium sp. J367]
MGGVTILPVTTPAELDRFIRLPMRLNAGDPNYIAPLVVERREALTPKTNPFFAHAEVQLWLAVRDGRDVGRISAQIDRLMPERSRQGRALRDDRGRGRPRGVRCPLRRR